METMYVVPADGCTIRDPGTMRPLPAEGAEVPVTQHWLRRLARGDVRVIARPPTGGILDPEAAASGSKHREGTR